MEGKLINGFQFLSTLWSPSLTKKSEMNKDVAQENQLLCSMLINDISNWRKWFVFLNLEFIRKGFLHFSKSYDPQRRSRNDQKSVISQKAFHVPRQQELNESHTLTAGQTPPQKPSAHTPHTPTHTHTNQLLQTHKAGPHTSKRTLLAYNSASKGFKCTFSAAFPSFPLNASKKSFYKNIQNYLGSGCPKFKFYTWTAQNKMRFKCLNIQGTGHNLVLTSFAFSWRWLAI